jgi:hypothetical protein
MGTRAELRKRRSCLTQAWDQNVHALGDQRAADQVPGGVRTEIASSWRRSARHISPNVTEALLAGDDDTRAAFQASPLSTAVRHLEAELRATRTTGTSWSSLRDGFASLDAAPARQGSAPIRKTGQSARCPELAR